MKFTSKDLLVKHLYTKLSMRLCVCIYEAPLIQKVDTYIKHFWLQDLCAQCYILQDTAYPVTENNIHIYIYEAYNLRHAQLWRTIHIHEGLEFCKGQKSPFSWSYCHHSLSKLNI
jgi:hypothetical protein